MDTGTHIVMGFALGGLATLDPVVANDPVTQYAVLAGVVAGSQAPDIDTILKLRNNAVYIRNHRGATHSIPAVLLWPLLIAGGVYLLFPESNLLHLWLWTQLAVFLHVFVDIFNAYGTQALRPFSSKWVALGVINTFDPFIFFIHVAGLILWGIGFNPGYTFIVIYLILIGYYILRFQMQGAVKSAVKRLIPDAEEIIIAPTIRFNQWRIAVKSDTHFYVARGYRRSVTILDKYKRVPVPESKLFEAAKQNDNLAAFLHFSPVYRWEVAEYDDCYEVKFIDLRYRNNGHYPFVAVVQLDLDHNVIGSYTGWIFSEQKLRKKLQLGVRPPQL
ncbi:inner membrane protein [Bacillus ectoiniformans]|uniref:metal-dependent hydrolase n=1 Tax=Bacillus ectoiniformans TaxID=1494429 RepID=UPI00195961ED|nr:metal-dependent hydrolase [Bacillus ectoiniformans]MBM7650255.1 inner membrane protein [Bacillus ectoiniformans]